ncbi:MAG TPA: hypothetical protein PLX20_00070 [Rhodocyclaceae bacterium]|nr:hypothetical protein [Rhodocyclaceae bacterium]HNC60211.1 hypothetical protein [Rhodocyclaceae bacterium]HNH11491.1 hypothetical protein [Rhodocyclaceae bacterium]
MTKHAIHTSNAHRADRIWLLLGGTIEEVRRTGERRYLHSMFDRPLRTNGRRNDVPAKLLSRINQVMKLRAANDANWWPAEETT